MKRLALLCLLMAVNACGPVMKTDFEVIPPHTAQGRSCANNCLLAKQNCSQNCQIQRMQCEEIERLRAQSDYLSYVNQQQRENRSITKSERDFYRYYTCPGDSCGEACGADWRQCHTNCGGKVIPHTYCTAFCN